MNKNEIKYIEDHEPTPKELDRRVIALAEEQQEGAMVDFYWFLIGWMTPNHHAEIAECARAWLGIHHPDKLEEFDSLSKE
jgi:hypothetical protein